MSLLGQFARVPEVLCHKVRKPGSLSRSWKFSNRQWLEVAGSCMRELWISELSTPEKLQLSKQLMQGMEGVLGHIRRQRQPDRERQSRAGH